MSVVKQNKIKRESFAGIFPGAKYRRAKNYFSRRSLIVFLLLGALSLAACRGERTALPPSDLPTREITDGLGKKTKLPAKIDRAVSLAPNLTEIAFAVGAGDRLVGVTSFCDYPEQAKQIQKIGDTLNPNVETIIALKPQVVLVSTASQMENFTKTLEQQNIAVFVTSPNSLDDIYGSISQLGEIFGTAEQAARLVDEMKRRVAAVEAKTADAKKMRVFAQIDKNSLYTVGKDSFITDLIRRAGGESLTADLTTAYPKISRETALALKPEAIIVSDSENNREPNEVFADSPAVRNGKVFRVNADLLSRPGPRVVDGLEQIAKNLHPEKFE